MALKGSLKSLVRSLLWQGALRRVRAEKPRVIAITGTVGKTSTKEAIAQVLAATGKPVWKTPGNLGSDMGVALALVGCDEQPGTALEWLRAVWSSFRPPITDYKGARPYYVLEYSADAPGDIRFLCEKIRPDVGVLTVITPAHMANYPSFEALVAEKLTLAEMTAPDGYLVMNGDDPAQEAYRKADGRMDRFTGYALTEGTIAALWSTPLGLVLPFKDKEIRTKVYALHQLQAIQAAATLGLREGLSLDQVAEEAEEYEVPAGRGRLIEGRDGVTIIDESYNASPAAVNAALQAQKRFAEVGSGTRRRVAILGRMGELGDESPRYHREVGEEAGRVKIDLLICTGDWAAEMAAGSGLPPERVKLYPNALAIIDDLPNLLLPGDLVLVKASQNQMRFERIVKKLMAHPEEAERLLVRQEPYWLRSA